jgi:hypothetical protein
MIVLNIGENNKVLESASRNKELGNPTYLFSFYHKLSGKTWRVIPYVSDYTEDFTARFDTFYINIDYDLAQSLSGNNTDTSTNVHLIEGDYWVSIYEQYSTTNLDPSKSFNRIIETFGYVVPPTETNPTYEGNNYNYKIYEE